MFILFQKNSPIKPLILRLIKPSISLAINAPESNPLNKREETLVSQIARRKLVIAYPD
jgi:hypothetical protein